MFGAMAMGGGPPGPAGDPGTPFDVQMPVAQAFTSGVAFQPNLTSPFALNVNASLTGMLAVNGTCTIAVCATQGGAYFPVATMRLTVAVLGLADDGSCGTAILPAAVWVKITLTGAVTATAVRMDA